MQKSLKKQIFQSKVSNFLKTHSIILFFATFDLPQRKRGQLKKQINTILNKTQAVHNTGQTNHFLLGETGKKKDLHKAHTQKATMAALEEENGVFAKQTPQSKESIVKQTFPATFSKSSIFPLMSKNLNTTETLHINNKCFQNLIKCSKLPLYGQTLIVALRHEEDLVFFSTFFSLYKGILLGGFYKSVPQTKNYLSALCNKAHHKGLVNRDCIKVLSATSTNLHKTVHAVLINWLRLLNHIHKL